MGYYACVAERCGQGTGVDGWCAVVPGWNLLGPAADVTVADVLGIEGMTLSFWRWDAVSQRLTSACRHRLIDSLGMPRASGACQARGPGYSTAVNRATVKGGKLRGPMLSLQTPVTRSRTGP